MPSIGHISVWITVDGERATEYREERDGENSVKCHIQSETSKSFQIGIGEYSGTRENGLFPTAKVVLDGHKLSLCWTIAPDEEERVIEGIATVDSFQSFAFANLNVCEHENEENTSNVGMIRVTVDWRKFGTRVPPSTDPELDKLNKAQSLHEKAKKLTTHRVILGGKEPRKANPLETWNTYKTVSGYPTYEFQFHYANKDLLIAQGIIPNPVVAKAPPPKTTTQKRRRDPQSPQKPASQGLTAEEERLLKRLQKKKARHETSYLGQVKNEIKNEPGLPLATNDSGVIDLTEDD